jgi:hypothetical protein
MKSRQVMSAPIEEEDEGVILRSLSMEQINSNSNGLGTTTTASARSQSRQKFTKKKFNKDSPLITADKLVIATNDSRIVFWDMFLLLMLFYQTWAIPFEIGVSGGHLWRFMGVGGLMLAESVNVVFFCDTILYFFRETRDDHGRLVWKLKDIAQRYASGWFLADLVSCVPVDTIAYVTQTKQGSTLFHVLMILQTLKLFRLSRIQRRLRGSPSLQRFSLRLSMVPLQIAFIFLVSVYVAHCMACVWCFTSNLEDGKTWMEKFLASQSTELQPAGDTLSNILDMYVLGLYWASVTLVSLGYGDVTPYTRAEYWVCSVCILVSAFLWAWVVASMVDLVGKVEHDAHQLDTHLAAINRFWRENRPRDPVFRKDWDSLLDEARIYLQTTHLQRQKQQSIFQLYDTLQVLSPSLRFRVSLAQAERTLLRLSCFQSCRISTVAFLASKMTLLSLGRGEIIVDDKTDILNRERALYFLNCGACFSSDLAKDEEGEIGELKLANYVYRSIIRGDLATDRIVNLESMPNGRTSSFRKSKVSLVSENSVWDLDRFVLERSSSFFRPARLFAVTFCEFNILPRSALLEAMEMDPALKHAVRWRIVRIGMKTWARKVLSATNDDLRSTNPEFDFE